ncbi:MULTISPECIES: ATP-binding protein [Actinomadura]|uniref:Helix-turn-helix transcriptional regulator n=1 Tax=Actinomadura geliboluensis TaxID=882440 RepID=A0A5S4HCA0_9ACTN|nr:LuxR family transcriptional regulator [Actinomadura geliboluensis]TMR42381.1 helix-turn-helix transcriptional regulator [Actinomadura geliboluensis]
MGGRLVGRTAEQSVIERLLARARGGGSGALVLRGDIGIGKTALLDQTADRAGGSMRVLRGAGFESEADLPFAGLHLLLRGTLDAITDMPSRQARALRGALGLEQSAEEDRLRVGSAVLSMLAGLAKPRPLVCLVDDAQWLDPGSSAVLQFVARRLGAEGVALVFAAREDYNAFPAEGLPELRLGGLDDASAARLLARHSPGLAPRARERLLDEARGNPLALRELPALLTPEQCADELPIRHLGVAPGPVPDRVLRAFRDPIARLPARSRTLLLVAAADDTGALDVVLRAADELGAGIADVDTAEAAGLVDASDGRIAFRHPLARVAAYRQAPMARRLAVHRALADALRGRPADVDRRSWHLAAGTTRPDEETAAALELGAEHVRAEGGYAEVSALYERAARFSPDPGESARRLAAAASAAADAGQFARATTLAAEAEPDAADPTALAGLARTRAMVAMAEGYPESAHRLLTGAADAVAGHSPDAAVALYFEALIPAWTGGDYAAMASTAQRVSDLDVAGGPSPLVRALTGMGRLAAEESPTDLSWLRELIGGSRDSTRVQALQDRARLAIWDLVVGDDTASYARAAAIERECRARRADGLLPLALALLARSQMFLGMHADALASAREGLRVARQTGQRQYAALQLGVMMYIAAVEGDEERCLVLAEEIGSTRDTAANGLRCVSLNLLDLALGRPEAALRRAAEFGVFGPAARTVMVMHRLPDLLEAAVRAGWDDFAHAAAESVRVWAAQTPQPWAEAVALRCRAMLASGEESERLYERALRAHLRGGRSFERARTELLYGEWLRRARRRADARRRLRSAAEIFDRLGARPWADRARAELRAAGEGQAAAGHACGPLDRLTPQELQIVRLAGSGLSNREIGVRLALSPRTIGYHLYKAYPKLGVASRAELSRLDLGGTADN